MNKKMFKEFYTKLTEGIDLSHATLDIISSGDDFYARQVIKAIEGNGGRCFHTNFYNEDLLTTDIVISHIKIAKNIGVTGILLQLPFPEQVDMARVEDCMCPSLDVDCISPVNLGLLMCKRQFVYPTVISACLLTLDKLEVNLKGKDICIIGGGRVGRSLSLVLIDKGATVTVCDINTEFIEDYSKKADIVIVAIGSPEFIGHEYLAPYTNVLDVGCNLVKNGVVGDVSRVDMHNMYVTPVPGGIGKITMACLIRNLYYLKCAQDAGMEV